MGDYGRKTAHLTMMEDGAFRRLLDHYYSTRQPLPTALLTLHRICRAVNPEETQAVNQVVNEFFVLRDDGWHNSRADQELTAWNEIAERNRENGKTGGRPKTQTDAVAKPSPEVRSQKLEVRGQTPETIKNKNNATAPQKNGFVLPDWIPAEHWNAWIEARTKARKPITDYAKRLAVRKLANFNERGHPPGQVLMRSAMNSWADLFEPKD